MQYIRMAVCHRLRWTPVTKAIITSCKSHQKRVQEIMSENFGTRVKRWRRGQLLLQMPILQIKDWTIIVGSLVQNVNPVFHSHHSSLAFHSPTLSVETLCRIFFFVVTKWHLMVFTEMLQKPSPVDFSGFFFFFLLLVLVIIVWSLVASPLFIETLKMSSVQTSDKTWYVQILEFSSKGPWLFLLGFRLMFQLLDGNVSFWNFNGR
mmetsp:Transcript_14845/g.27831  ORF Transcript_14845/g.27831 Transcript_14845/m.27831 type:complete len:206 (+) Transcript_14845:967-1584(+)